MPSDKIKDPRRFPSWMQWAAVKAFRSPGEWILAEEFRSHAGYLAELRKFRAFRHSLAEFPVIAAALEAPPPGTWKLVIKVEQVEAIEHNVMKHKRQLYCRMVERDQAAEEEKQARRREALDDFPFDPEGSGG